MNVAVRGYLFCFNVALFCGFGFTFLKSIEKFNELEKVFDNAQQWMRICILMCFMEAVHPILGFVKTGCMAPLLQASGRAFVFFAVIDPVPEMHREAITGILFIVWSGIEIFRYPFYAFSLILNEGNTILGGFTWLRYSIWVPLYPVGMGCEFYLMYKVLPFVVVYELTTYEFLNKNGIPFNFTYFLMGYMAVFPFCKYILSKL
eukprot:Nk52_evm60s914 gene=Nk52_evmTU60s914